MLLFILSSNHGMDTQVYENQYARCHKTYMCFRWEGGAKQVSNIEILFLNTLYILLLLSTHEDLQQEYNIEFFHVCIDI